MLRLPALALVCAASVHAQGTTEVTVQSFSFTPASVTVEAGDTVRWSNAGGTHNVRSLTGPAAFESGEPASTEWRYAFTFTEPGTYTYQCDVHGTLMQGTVVVQGGTAADEGPDGRLRLAPDGPNPFLERAAFQLTVGRAQRVRAVVLDPLGREVAVLLDATVPSGGPVPLVWRAGDAPPGAYVLRVEGEGAAVTRGLVRAGRGPH